jgi:hypothetical protein
MEVSGQLHPPLALPPEKHSPGTHWIRGWVGPKADLEAVPGIELRLLGRQPVASLLYQLSRLAMLSGVEW